MRLCFKVESQPAAEDVYVEKKGQLREVFSERVRYFMRTCRLFTDCRNGYRGPFKRSRFNRSTTQSELGTSTFDNMQNANRESRSNMKNVGTSERKARNA